MHYDASPSSNSLVALYSTIPAPLYTNISNRPQIWDPFEGKHMFYGKDPDAIGDKVQAQLAEFIAILPQPRLDLFGRGSRSKKFFDDAGQRKADIPIPQDISVDRSEENREGNRKEEFLGFIRSMLPWRPEDLETATQLSHDPFLKDVLGTIPAGLQGKRRFKEGLGSDEKIWPCPPHTCDRF